MPSADSLLGPSPVNYGRMLGIVHHHQTHSCQPDDNSSCIKSRELLCFHAEHARAAIPCKQAIIASGALRGPLAPYVAHCDVPTAEPCLLCRCPCCCHTVCACGRMRSSLKLTSSTAASHHLGWCAHHVTRRLRRVMLILRDSSSCRVGRLEPVRQRLALDDCLEVFC